MAVGRIRLQSRATAVRLLALGLVTAIAAKALSSALLDAVGGADRLQQSAATVPGTVEDALLRGLFGTTPAGDWRWLVLSAPHSGTTLDLVHTTGTALAVLGACLLLARTLPRAVTLPLVAAGSMTFTLYAAHVLALSSDSPFLLSDRSELWLVHVGVALVVATLWRTAIGRGPLEALAAWLDRGARRLVTPRRSRELSVRS
jgi:hypothetical protein